MIYTLTCNPAIDYIIIADNISKGKINRTSAEKILPGGKGINVSVVLKNLGTDSVALGFTAGFTGGEIERLLINEGIRTDFIRLKSGNSRINIKLKDSIETEINGQGPEVDCDALKLLYSQLDELCDGDFLVLSGSAAKGVPDTIYCDIMKRLKNKNINIAVDAQKSLLKAVLPHKPFLIKPNHYELGSIFHKNLETTDEVIKYALKLREEGARNVFVTMAEKGGIFAGEDGSIIYANAPKGKVINSIGAGDSALAGFLNEYIASGDCKKSLIRGICTGSASAFSGNLAQKSDADALAEQTKAVYM